jgi:hypothetical protein
MLVMSIAIGKKVAREMPVLGRDLGAPPYSSP